MRRKLRIFAGAGAIALLLSMEAMGANYGPGMGTPSYGYSGANYGANYGPGGAGHLRIVLGVYRDDEKVYDALRRICAALKEFAAR